MITRLFPSQCNVYSKGPVGENVFHISMLLNTPSTLAIAKYLVKLYGKTLVNTPYQERKSEADPPGQYEGESALHIAIVNHDFDMVRPSTCVEFWVHDTCKSSHVTTALHSTLRKIVKYRCCVTCPRDTCLHTTNHTPITEKQR